MNVPLSQLPRHLTLHQLSERSGVHRGKLAMLMAKGQLAPAAMLETGEGRETFLFPVDVVARIKSPSSPLPL